MTLRSTYLLNNENHNPCFLNHVFIDVLKSKKSKNLATKVFKIKIVANKFIHSRKLGCIIKIKKIKNSPTMS